MKAVLLAAGRGTRMGALTAAMPKPLLPVNDKPILGHIIAGMAAAGVREIVVVTGYLGEQIERAFGDGADLGVSLTYRRQERPDGTGGALLLARDLVEGAPFMLSWGDILVEPRLYRFMAEQFAASPCDVLLSLNPVDDPWRGAAVYVDVGGRVERIVEKPPRGSSSTHWNNAGIFVFAPLVLDYAARLAPSPRGEYELPQAIARMVDDGRDVRAVPVGDFWSDVGTPDDLAAAQAHFAARSEPGGFAHKRSRELVERAAPAAHGEAKPRPGGALPHHAPRERRAPHSPRDFVGEAERGRASEGARRASVFKDAQPMVQGVPESDPTEARRIADLVAAFTARFAAAPEAVVSAPGRVNLIGEHTDYNGLPVLPMAIDRSVLMAVRRRGGASIELANAEPRFAPRAYELSAEISPYSDGDWGNYHKAAVQGLIGHLHERDVAWRGGQFLVAGDVPSGAGLSSSSAFVVASGLAFLAANDVDVAPAELAEVLARAERYVGTLSGGMDHAASLLAQAGHALRIDFFPLRVQPVRLPAGIAVVVCDSLVRAEKSAGARDAYNTRVVECRLACRVMERALKGSLPRGLVRLGDLREMFPERPLADFVDALAGALPDGPLRLADVAKAAGVTPAQLESACEIPRGMPDRFSILPRARHVLSEADRVTRAVAALTAAEMAELGVLMAASHRSCRDDYEVSCRELDELVEVAVRAGALGARLTGAGFGGCTVNLVRVAEVDAFLAKIDRDFYRSRLAAGDDPSQHRFVFTARRGATVTSC